MAKKTTKKMAKKTTKNRINSKRKGNSVELELAKLLSEHFGVSFARVGVASGARAKNTKLPGRAVGVMTGDIITPEGFKFSIECKATNINVDFLAPSAAFDQWLQQAADDAQSVGKIPMVCWKQNRKGWIVAVPARSAFIESGTLPHYYIRYGNETAQWTWGWIVCRLDELFATNGQDWNFWWEKEGIGTSWVQK